MSFTSSGQVSVFAGNDQIICSSDSLVLSSLQATISGGVSNGHWFTQGDGYFLPIQATNRFSTATRYVPGVGDKILGSVNLILVSDDPDGIGPLTQVSDMVMISFMQDISIVCPANVNVSLGSDCTQKLSPQMLVANVTGPLQYYNLELINFDGKKIAANTLTYEHIGKYIQYSVGHKCGGVTCWGVINVKDKLPPQLQCKNRTVFCGVPTLPDSIGLPIPALAKKSKINANSFRVLGVDACGPSTLSYSDTYTDLKCVDTLQGRIFRTWIAVDSFGNTSNCVESITIRTRLLSQVLLPPNFDGIDKPYFHCNDTFPRLANGHPAPDTTGYPKTDGCKNLERFFTDVVFDQCGSSYHILRKWTIINWCGTLTLEHNQIIKIKDTRAPTFNCPKDTVVTTSYDNCTTGNTFLPSPSGIQDCSQIILDATLEEQNSGINYSHLISKSNGRLAFSGLPIGNYKVTYIVGDVCGNADSCVANISVIDKAVPIAVCDQVTKVSVSNDGFGRLYAMTLDDGSFDNCTIATIKIGKMAERCKPNQSIVFGEYIDFCCKDIGMQNMVSLQVTDNFGNTNTCMVDVVVEDKLSPTLKCPSNLTVSCRNALDSIGILQFGTVVKGQANVKPIVIQDGFNQGIAGYDGYYIDNCDVTFSTSISSNVDCGKGIIQRTFTAKDPSNNTTKCTQSIKVDDEDRFSIDDIKWPNLYVELNGCDVAVAGIAITGEPIFSNLGCARVDAAHEDQVFYDTDGACIKILRKWTVIDWCQYEPSLSKGIWTRAQTIKIHNTIKPKFDVPCRDTIFCLYTAACRSDRFTYIPMTSDDCTSPSQMRAVWTIDYQSDGVVDTTATSLAIVAWLAPGSHKVTYTIIDHCENKASCTFTVQAVDCKKPTPYCVTETVSVVMPSSGNLSLKATMFDLGSSDNCTAKKDLSFAYSTSPADSIRVFSCADLVGGETTILDIKVYVIDQKKNYDYCAIKIKIEDHDDTCPDQVQKTDVSGIIYDPTFANGIKNTKLTLNNLQADEPKYAITKVEGEYVFKNTVTANDYSIKPSKNDSIQLGLSTLDIIQIQRHILGVASFTDPFKIIAADVDANRKVNVADLVSLRRVILGVTSSFPKNIPCYTFVPINYSFPNPKSPFPYPDSTKLAGLTPQSGADHSFVGIKRGDVNYSAFQIKAQRPTDQRSAQTYFLHTYRHDKAAYFTLDTTMATAGFQVEIAVDPSASLEVNHRYSQDVEAHSQNGKIRLIYAPTQCDLKNNDAWIFKIMDSKKINLVSPFCEAYDDKLSIYPITLQNQSFVLDKTTQNWSDLISISAHNGVIFIHNASDDDMIIDLTIYNALGQNLGTMRQVTCLRGSHQLDLPLTRLMSNQLLFLEASTADHKHFSARLFLK